MFSLNYKSKQIFFVLIKISIVVGAFYFIYQKLTTIDNLSFSVFLQFMDENDAFSLKNVIFLLFLTIFNWFFEILKWQKLVSSVTEISVLNATKQSLAALTASIFTPNRIGDYAVKAIYYSKNFRKQILLLNLLGHMAQMGTTLFFGIVGFFLFSSKYGLHVSYFKLARLLFLVVIVGLFVFLGIRQNNYKIRGFQLSRIKDFITSLKPNIHFYTMAWSITRYLIFSFQFFFLFNIFGIDVSYINAMIAISTFYLLSSIIPSIFIFDVVIKGSVALYLFSIVGINELSILSIVTLMWLLNFVIPSIFGSFFVLKFNYKNAFVTSE